MRRIITEEGFRGLYKGLGPTLVGYIPTRAIHFGCYHKFRTELSQTLGRSYTDPIIEGLAAAGTG